MTINLPIDIEWSPAHIQKGLLDPDNEIRDLWQNVENHVESDEAIVFFIVVKPIMHVVRLI